MSQSQESLARLRRLAMQQLESLQRSGVRDVTRHAVDVIGSAIPTPSPTVSSPAASSPAASSPAASLPTVPVAPPSPVPVATVTAVAPGTVHLPESTAPQEVPMAKRAATKSADRESVLAQIRQEVAGCQRCGELACRRTQTVFGVGNLRPRLCFFGEAPGADEDRQGEPFVGRAGQLLTDIIEKGMRLRRSDVFILNVLKCRPPENRTPTDEEIANCREYFERQFAALQPEFICCLGATATKALLGHTGPLGRLRGQWFEYGKARVLVTYHPSYLLRQPSAKKDVWEDIQLVMREMGLPIEKK